MKYKVVAVIWNDHLVMSRQPLPIDPDTLIKPTITFGILYKKTKQSITIASDIEPYDDHIEATYTVILRSTIDAIKEFGEIEIENL